MFRSIFTNSFGILFSRITGFIRDLLTASILGANLYSDIFFIAFKLPNLFRRIFGEGAFSQTFLPSFTASRHKSVFAIKILMHFSIIILILTLVVNLFPFYAAKAIAFGFSNEVLELSKEYVAINFYYLPLIFLVTFFSALLHYKEHFSTTAFATSLLNLSLIVALIFSQNSAKEEIVYALSYAVLIGGLLQVIAHIIALKRLNFHKILIGGIKYHKKKKESVKKELSSFNKKFIPAIMGSSTAQISAFLDTWLASFLAVGSISYLYYANRVFQLPLALFAIATSIALFPAISKAINNNNEKKVQAALQKAFWFLMFTLSFSLAGGIILSEGVIRLLFERGAFMSEDTAQTAFVFVMYLLGLLPFGLSKLFSLYLYANHQMAKAAKISVLSLGVNILLSLLFIKPLGSAGLALASSLSGMVLFILTLKVYGFKAFFAIIRLKISVIFLLSLTLFSLILYYLKGFIYVYI